jgi:pimeloyl-ACP methyl ester carboxylesterase
MLAVVVLWGSACARNLGAVIRETDDLPAERVVGLYPCTEGGRGVLDLDPGKPLTVLVHGCRSSGARFKTLSKVFEAHGQQAICFNYNDRDSINTSAAQLDDALRSLHRRLEPQELTILGHSQGGLVARRALQLGASRGLTGTGEFSYRLVTVSTPFSGIESSADCGRWWLHVLTLSTTVAVCLAITGNKWPEIHPGSRFLTNPQPIIASRHLQIVTDERDTCRRRAADGSCAEGDFVFGVQEQRSEVVSHDPNLTTVEVRAGHAAVVGENGVVQTVLLQTLEREGILRAGPSAAAPSADERAQDNQ